MHRRSGERYTSAYKYGFLKSHAPSTPTHTFLLSCNTLTERDMSQSRDDYYYSTSRPSKRGDDEFKQETRLPSIRNAVGDSYPYNNPQTSSTYNFHDVKYSLPNVPHGQYQNHTVYDKHYSQHGPKLAPMRLEPTSDYEAHSTYPSTAHSSSRQYPPHVISSTSNSSRSNAAYPSNDGHSFQAFYAKGSELVPVSASATRPQGVVRKSDIPDESYDPKKKYKCPQCGKGFDRPSGLEQHVLRHTGDKPYACPATNCDKFFNVRSNMKRHYQKQHGEFEEPADQDDRESNRHSTYSGTSRGSSDKSSPPAGAYYSSSRRVMEY
ncbi:hypothetical protein K439DRAFT_539987 [Ramaria rubella]|nr:hypothetical protein K439DRAFT_539987 [Ramaria rubella]